MNRQRHTYPRKAPRPLDVFFFFLLFSITILCPYAHGNQTKHILILHSYHQDHTWTDNIMRGVKNVLDDAIPNYALSIEYMDTKRHAPKESFEHLSRLYEFRYRDVSFDAIIVSDNNALDFLLSHRKQMFPNVPVVFCGINGFTNSLIDGHSEITGVEEDIDIKGTLELALNLYPKTTQIAVISDQTPTGRNLSKQIRMVISDFRDTVTFFEFIDETANELQETLKQLSKDTLILPLVFFEDREGVKFSDKEFIPLIANSRELPLFSMWEHYMGLGVMGGIVTSGEQQGFHAARMAVRILQGESAENIPILHNSPNVPMFDYVQLKRFGVSLSKLPSESIILNKPFSFYQEYTKLIWTVSVLFLGLIAFIVILWRNILLRKTVETELQNHRDHLEDLVKERTTALSVANELLKDNEERFRSLSSAAFEGIILFENASILEANATMSDMFGYQTEELVGMAVTDLADPSVREDVLQKILSAYEYKYESFGITKNGSKFPVEVQTKTFSYRGRPVRVSAIRDLTEQKKAEEEIKTLQDILPICSYCKNIRNDQGYFEKIESYMHKHSGVDFSHTICNSCLEEHYPDDFEYLTAKKKE